MQAYLPLRKTCLKSKQDILQTERIFIMPEYKKVGYLTTDFKMFQTRKCVPFTTTITIFTKFSFS